MFSYFFCLYVFLLISIRFTDWLDAIQRFVLRRESLWTCVCARVCVCDLLLSVFLGQTDVMHQSVFELIHTEDQQEFRRNLHWALNPPTSAQPEDSPPGQ